MLLVFIKLYSIDYVVAEVSLGNCSPARAPWSSSVSLPPTFALLSFVDTSDPSVASEFGLLLWGCW